MTADTEPLDRDLASAVRGPVRFDRKARALYSTDASNYRHVPLGVVEPLDVADVVATIDVCRSHGVPLLPRGAGTSVGGQGANTAVVMDLTKHLHDVLEIDSAAATARVQPGIVLDRLQDRLAPHRLMFGPDPSTHSRCSIGGMIGNNACGSHSVAWGKTVDNVLALDVITYDGNRLTVGPTPEPDLDRLCAGQGRTGQIYRDLRTLRDTYGAEITSSFPALTRRVSGYNLDQLLPGAGFDLAKALVGTEGTCVTVVGALLRLVPAPPARVLVVLGFADAFAAADHVLEVLEHEPLAVEGIDAGLVAALRSANPSERATAGLPPGVGWLLVEAGGPTPAEATARGRAIAEGMQRRGATAVVVEDPAEIRQLWRIREEGAGIVTRLPGGAEAWPGWEDAAVPPERLGSYLRQFAALLAGYGLQGCYYGHFGDGCVHVRIDFDLLSSNGVARFRAFMEDAADLVVSHGGSLSGEHGDGQARSELLGRMYPPRILEAFGRFKAIWDPADGMNPGRIVAPAKLDADLRVHVATPTLGGRTHLAFAHDNGSFAAATRRCVGVGKCLAPDGGVMCPSYRATGAEEHSTRGRARLLFEMASGRLLDDGWRSPEVAEALDLCLSCKGCKRDCPVGVDMAAYKAEFLSHHFHRRLRPASHYSMGFLPLWARLAARAPRLVNAFTGQPQLAALAKAAGGIAAERSIPAFADTTFTRWFARRPTPAVDGPPVLLLPDTFTNFFDPAIGRDAVAVLEALGYRVEVPSAPLCCGLTWLSTGQLGVARRVLRRTLRVLGPWLDRQVPVIGLEPSCTALLRSDATELLPLAETSRLSEATRTFAGFLATHRGPWPALSRPGQRAVAQVHCHQHADLGFDDDRSVLARLDIEAQVLDSGCCGLAGNFGFERGHYDVSMACADRVLLPAVEAAADGVEILADGFSCRTQVRQATTRRPLHLAQMAARAIGVGDAPDDPQAAPAR